MWFRRQGIPWVDLRRLKYESWRLFREVELIIVIDSSKNLTKENMDKQIRIILICEQLLSILKGRLGKIKSQPEWISNVSKIIKEQAYDLAGRTFFNQQSTITLRIV